MHYYKLLPNMKNKYSHNENLLRNALLSDVPGISPDKAIAERLNYHFLLTHPFRRVYLNSFAGMFSWIFSLKNFGFKASLASALLAYMLLFGNIKNNSDGSKFTDGYQINTLAVDTNFTFKDTCWQMNTKN